MYSWLEFSPSSLVSEAAVRSAKRQRGGFYRDAGKRVFDVLFVLTILPFLLPLIGLLALFVRRDGGPAFYLHKRVGRYGRRFTCFKLRTMVPDGDRRLEMLLAANPDMRAIWNRRQKLDDDPRVTKLGAFLRRSSLDELPQFLNVLIGDMSIVGPRPFLPEQETRYRAGGGGAYYANRPGITGPWQVGSRDRSSFEARVRFDEAYCRKIGLFSDLRTIISTLGVVWSGTGV